MRFAEKSVTRRFTKKVDSHGSVNSMCRVDSWSRFMETIHGKVRVANLSTARRRFILENTTAQLVGDSSPKTPRHSSSTIHPQKHHGTARRRFIPKTARHSSSTIHPQKHHGTARRRFILKNTTAQLVGDSFSKTPWYSTFLETIHTRFTRFTLDSFDSHSIHSIHSGVELWSRFKSTFKLWKQVSGRFMKTPKVDSRSRFMPK